MRERSHAFTLTARLLIATVAGCATHSYLIETREPMIVTASPTCIKRAISARNVIIETRTEDGPNGIVWHLFFDLAKGEFNLAPEMRDYHLDWHRIESGKLALTLGWEKRGNAITALQRRQVHQAIERIYDRLSTDCGLAKTKLALIES